MAADLQYGLIFVGGGNLIVAMVVGFFMVKFSKAQASIAKMQAETASTQAKTARFKLKLDLYEKRMAIYHEVAKLLRIVARTGNATNDELIEFIRGIDTAKWLFNDEIHNYFEMEIYKKVNELQAAADCAKGLSTSPELTKLVSEQRALKTHLSNQWKVIDDKLSEFLILSDS
jgi:hypothetical protein